MRFALGCESQVRPLSVVRALYAGQKRRWRKSAGDDSLAPPPYRLSTAALIAIFAGWISRWCFLAPDTLPGARCAGGKNRIANDRSITCVYIRSLTYFSERGFFYLLSRVELAQDKELFATVTGDCSYDREDKEERRAKTLYYSLGISLVFPRANPDRTVRVSL